MKTALKTVNYCLTKMRLSGLDFETNEKDIMLLAFLSKGNYTLEMETLYGKEFVELFYKYYYPEQLFL